MNNGIIETILDTCGEIKNDRTIYSIVHHLKGEVIELEDELYLDTPGEDGIIGEAVDVILCAVDAIHKDNPNVTPEEIMAVVVRKLEKWKRLYG